MPLFSWYSLGIVSLFSNYATGIGFGLMALLFSFLTVLALYSPHTFSSLGETPSGGMVSSLFLCCERAPRI